MAYRETIHIYFRNVYLYLHIFFYLLVYVEAIWPGSNYGKFVVPCWNLHLKNLVSGPIDHYFAIYMVKYCLKILNLKSSGNVPKKFYTSVGNAKYERLQHSTYRLILCCNSNYEKSEINVTGLLSSDLTLIRSRSPFPSQSKLKRPDSLLYMIHWR